MSNKIYPTGLIIGKFYPLHLGHEFLIKTALTRVKKLTIIICQADRYHIPVETRVAWIRELFPQVDIRIIINHSPRLDSVSTTISQEWAQIVSQFLGFIPNVVFSSEAYGSVFAKYLGSRHVLVDQPRHHFPISGTVIRDNPLGNWAYLSDPAKSYFAKRIVIVGAESTGTTTLSIDLAKHYQTVWVPEYGRVYSEAKLTSSDSSNWTSAEFIHIAQQQNAMEDNLARISNGLLICDTDSWATRIWHRRYVGSWSQKLDSLSNQSKDLYILTDVDIPFVQDGTRDGEHLRTWMHNLFLEELRQKKLNYLLVSGTRSARLYHATTAIDIIINRLHE